MQMEFLTNKDREIGNVWKYFIQISNIPRETGNENRIRNFLIDFARQRNFQYISETSGNLIIKKKGSSQNRNHPSIVLQCHMDMVCEKNEESSHDFSSDRISLIQEGDWIRADNTTLGADNGIGMAMILAILDCEKSGFPHIEALFTVHEESGLIGARELNKESLTGAYLLNLDSEKEGDVYIGCAGGIRLQAVGESPNVIKPENRSGWTLEIHGLKGGHSGIDINSGRGNALLIAFSIIDICLDEIPIILTRIEGGEKENIIPRSCSLDFTIPIEYENSIKKQMELLLKNILIDYIEREPDIKIQLIPNEDVSAQTNSTFTKTLCNIVKNIPNGVINMSSDLSGVVETSSNLGAIHLKDGQFSIVTSQRSFIEEEKYRVSKIVANQIMKLGVDVEYIDPYPGWIPDPNSQFLRRVQAVSISEYGRPLNVTAIHAGLECGYFKEKMPQLDCISLGPDIEAVHSPNEKLRISSTEKVFHFVLKILEELAS